MSTKMVRQGDVLLVRAVCLPKGAVRQAGTTVAYGEVTGHHHSFAPETVEVYQVGELMFVVAEEPATLTHQEHAPIMVDAGVWEVRIQREYTPAAPRRVLD